MKPFSDALLEMLLGFGWSKPSPGHGPDEMVVLSLLGRAQRWDPEFRSPRKPALKEKTETTSEVETFRKAVRKGLELLRDGEEWELPSAREAIVDLHRRGHDVPDGLRHFYSGSDATILIRSAVSIIEQRWNDVRWCRYDRCRRPFLRKGKLEHCSPAHAQRARYSRWKENHMAALGPPSSRKKGKAKK